jgi:predicted molibdopterin-dependent oxidoreductase YjgC
MTRTNAQTVKLTIDHVEVVVEKGKTILEAAQSAGIRIPNLCYDRRLIPFGACRLCVVQQKGKSELLPSCFTPAKEGMEILTHSPEIIESRRLQLQLILLNHPMTCPRCEKEGDCGLQSLVYEYGVEDTLYPWERTAFPADDVSSLLQRDPNKCILCGRCARICDEVQGVGELSFTRRGVKTAIDTDFQRPLQCEFCGQCLDTCPVGAITSDRFDKRTKSWELTETTTPCPYCGCGCSLTMGSKEGEVKYVFSDPEKGPSDGNLCVKGRFGWDFIDHPERIKAPLLRQNGTFKEVSWEEALRFVTSEFDSIKGQYGPEAIAGMTSTRLTTEEIYLFQKLLRDGLGTDQIVLGDSQSLRSLKEGLTETLGWAASTNSIREIRNADCLLVIGADPGQTNPIVKNEIHLAIRRNRAHLIVLGYQDIDLSRATHLSPLFPSSFTLLGKPGTEVSTLNAMIQTILKTGLEDKKFIEEKTEGIKELKERMAALEPFEGNREKMEAAAKLFAQARKAMILIASGPWSSLDLKGISIASANLALLTGHLGKESNGILLLLEKCNDQGAIDLMTLFDGEMKGEKDLFQKAAEGRLKALYLVGRDPLASSPAPVRKALEKMPLLIAQDLFMTQTARMAHVVLPACSFVEKSGTFTNLEGRVQRLNPLRPPIGQSKSDFHIFQQLLRLFERPDPGPTTETVFEEISRILPHTKNVQDGEMWSKGVPYLHGNGMPTGKAKFVPLEVRKPQPQPEAYPYQIVQKPSLFQSGLLSKKSDNLMKVSEKPYLEMNREDAQSLKIEDQEVIQVSTQQGQSLRMEVKHSAKLVPGVMTAPYPCALIDDGERTFVKVERLKK